MTTHYLPRRLDPACGADAEAMFAVQPGGGAFVFIHGFNGRASGTWHDFPGMLPGRPACASADAYFFGYDSLRTPATVSAAILRAFLQRVWAQPVDGTSSTTGIRCTSARGRPSFAAPASRTSDCPREART